MVKDIKIKIKNDPKWLFLALLLPAAIAAGSSNGMTNTRGCTYSCLRS